MRLDADHGGGTDLLIEPDHPRAAGNPVIRGDKVIFKNPKDSVLCEIFVDDVEDAQGCREVRLPEKSEQSF